MEAPDRQPEPVTARPKTARLTAAIVGAVVLGLIVVLALAAPGEEAETTRLLGQRAPATAGPILVPAEQAGTPFAIDDHRGSWVAVNFFATWCPPCVAEHDELVAFDAWANERGDVTLVSVVFNDTAENVGAFFAERGGAWPVLDNPAIAVDYGFLQIPETFLIAPSGQVVAHFAGEVTAEELQTTIAELS